jgi:hypothetical protein
VPLLPRPFTQIANTTPGGVIDWYPWGVFVDGNTLEQFRDAYRHVVDVLRSTGGNFKFQASKIKQSCQPRRLHTTCMRSVRLHAAQQVMACQRMMCSFLLHRQSCSRLVL